MERKSNIDFKFAKNWKTFFNWHKTMKAKKNIMSFEFQKQKMQLLFEATEPKLTDWKQLWIDLETWFLEITAKKHEVLWSEQQRQIETLMLNQTKELDKEQFVLVYLDINNKPCMDVTKMNYWEACRVKKQLEGDGNGVGGNQDMDKITVVNLKTLIK